MANPKIIYKEQLTPAESDTLFNGIEEFTAPLTGPSDRLPLSLLAYDEHGTLIGGIDGNTEKGWLYISALWVSPQARSLGLGSALMHQAEELALQRGCKNIYLDTLSCQAPEFYKRLGFTVFAELEDFPGNHKKIFLRKELQKEVRQK